MRSKAARTLIQVLMPLALLMGSFAVHAPRALAQSNPVVERVTDLDIEELFKKHNYSYEKIRDGVFKLKIMELQVLFFRKDTNLQLYAGFRKKPSCGVINEWNKGKRFSRAYLDKEGDAVVESDMDLEGGATMNGIKVFIDTFKMTLGAFVREVIK